MKNVNVCSIINTVNTTKHVRKLSAVVAPTEKSNRVATRLVQQPLVIGKRRLTEAPGDFRRDT